MTENKKKVDIWLHEEFSKLLNKKSIAIKPKKRIAIISTPRSGSTFFCESLASTNRFGDPSEWMNPRRISVFAKLLKKNEVKISEYLNFVASRTTSENGVFSVNFHVDHYIHWKKQNFNLFDIGFHHVFYIHREDKISQAFSYAKALVTDQWRSTFEPARKIRPSDISNVQIMNALRMQANWDDVYQRDFSSRIDTSFSYEEFTKNPDDTFRWVLNTCGVDCRDIEKFTSGLNVQRNEEDIARIEKFKQYLGLTSIS